MEIRQVDAKQGLQWLLSGFYLFRRTPLGWVFICGALLLIAISAALIPFIGSPIFTLVYPALLGGIMLGCRDLEEGKPLEITHLFSAIEGHLTALITIGGIYLTGLILVSGLAAVIGGPQMTDLLLYGKWGGEIQIKEIMSSMLTLFLILLTLSVPLMMASLFSPMLVVFHQMPPIMAMQQSLYACLRNVIPLSVYVIVLTSLIFLAILPYGAGLVILFPTMYASMYVCYKDIFLGEPIRFKDNAHSNPVQWNDSQKNSQENTDNNANTDKPQNENPESKKQE